MNDTEELLHLSVQKSLAGCGITDYTAMQCDPSLADTAAFCEHYKFSLDESANCIIVAAKAEPMVYVCCVVLANSKLDVNKTLRKLISAKRASFATREQTLEVTGMEIGGVTPFGVTGMPIYIDAQVMNQARVILGGGNRSSKLLLPPCELLKLPNARVIDGLAKPAIEQMG